MFAKTRYRGHLIQMRSVSDPLRRMHVSVTRPGRIKPYYESRCANLQQAMAYACNAVDYDLDGISNWPAGLPLIVKQVLHRPSDPPRVVTRHHIGRLLTQDGRVRAYLDEKKEDY